MSAYSTGYRCSACGRYGKQGPETECLACDAPSESDAAAAEIASLRAQLREAEEKLRAAEGE